MTDVAPDDTGVAIYRFANRAMAVLVNSSVTLAGENTTEIYGDQGVLVQNYTMTWYRRTLPRRALPPSSCTRAIGLSGRTSVCDDPTRSTASGLRRFHARSSTASSMTLNRRSRHRMAAYRLRWCLGPMNRRGRAARDLPTMTGGAG